MVDVDPDTLLEWLSMGHGEERDMQLIALEQLCMLLLMSDNVDRCFESCPPRVFLPALCRVFLDESAPENVLEVTARAITYYLDVSAECTRRIVSVDGAVKMLCNRLVAVDLESRTSKDLAEQCVKVLELMCTRETSAIFDAGGLQCTLTFINDFGIHVHKDTLHSSMSVVSRLCGRMEPQDVQLETCVSSLSALLKHDDAFVSDSALRCFTSVADRFTRRGMDPAPLAKHGLIEELLERLAKAGTIGGDRLSVNTGGTPDPKNASPSVTTVISLLSTLCRGSPVITELLLHSQLPDAIDKALQGDERCVLDTMRFVNLLLVLLFEGRRALPKTGLLSTPGSIPGLKRLDSSADRSHRQLIDCIRSKDTDALIDAIENGGFEVNFMDDVGQTLLNWASAFGTLEMVEYLCEKGADVNRGQRSSSLHYAACFGRPLIAKVLLRNGADPELRDEDGKTPADKARERHDEGHREVLEILQSPSDWMTPFNNSSNAPGSKNTETGSEKTKDDEKKEEDESTADPETAASYIIHLLPLFIKSYQTSMVSSVKKAVLGLTRKMIFYSTGDILQQLAKTPGFASGLVEVIAAVFENEDDDDGHMSALNIIQDLLEKANEVFIEHFARLGVISKVSEMIGPLLEEEEDETKKDEIDGAVACQGDKDSASVQEDASEILQSRPYHWKDWCLIRSRDCLYLWNESCALELSNGSNGWFRFILNNKLATMYSSGSPEGGSDSSESRGEFLEKLQRARGQVKPDLVSQPILSSANSVSLLVGNWSFACQKASELSIYNSDGQQTTILREDLPGFVFESNRGTKHKFTAETSLGAEFASGWSSTSGKKFVSKAEALKLKVKTTAREVQEKYFQTALSSPREVVTKLQDIVRNLYACCDAHEKNLDLNGENTWEKDIVKVLKTFLELLKDDKTVSSYELQTSGVVRALLHCLSQHARAPDDEKTQHIMIEKAHQRIELFKTAFGESVKSFTEHLDSFDAISPAVFLIRKLIAVLEMSDRLPVYSFESMGSGLQILTRRLRFRLERAPGENGLIDRTGRNLRIEPLTTVEALKNYLGRMVAKQWFDFDRNTFSFIKKVKTDPQVFTYTSDFDDNGILYWIGTNGRTTNDWVNPASVGLVVVSSSERRALPYGKLEDVVSRDAAALNCHTNDEKNAWFTIDLGLFVIPKTYTLRHARGYGRSALRNWLLEVSKDNKGWLTLKTHVDDTSLNEPGSTATWHLDAPEDKEGWRYIRIHQNGKNASNQTHYLSLSGFELYGTVVSAVEEALGKTIREHESAVKRHRKMKTFLKHFAGKGVRGLDGKWKEGDALDPGLEAALARELSEDWVEVAWAEGIPTALRNAAMNMRAGMKGLAGEPSSLYSQVAKYRSKHPVTGQTCSSGVSIKVETNTVSAGTLSSNVKNLEKASAAVDQSKGQVSAAKDTAGTSTTENAGKSEPTTEDKGEQSETRGTTKELSGVQKPDVATSVQGNTSGQTEDPAKLTAKTSEESTNTSETAGDAPDSSGTSKDTNNPSFPESSTTIGDGSKPIGTIGGFVAFLESVRDRNVRDNSFNTADTASLPAVRDATATSESGTKSTPDHTAQSSDQSKAITSSVATDEKGSEVVTSRSTEDDKQSGMIYTMTSASSAKAAALSVASTTSTTSSNPTSDSEVENIPMDCTLMADIDDDVVDDLPEPDDEDEDDEDDEDDDEDNEENEDEFEEMDESELHNTNMRSRRSWDDDFCLKRQFTALIPAFDPRPGRTNVQQIQDIEVPREAEPQSPSTSSEGQVCSNPEIELILKSPTAPGMPEIEITIPLDDPKSTIFSYVHKLALLSGKLKTERLRRIWEPTYTLVYNSVGNLNEAGKSSNESGEENSVENKRWSVKYVASNLGTDSLPKCDLINYLQEHADSAFLRKWKLSGSTKSIRKNRNCSQLVSAYKEFCKLYSPMVSKEGSASTSTDDKTSIVRKPSQAKSTVFSTNTNSLDSVEDILKLIRLLYSISTTSMEEFGENADENYGFIIPSEEFNSKKITTKLIQQIKDPLMSSSGSLPSWCEAVMSSYPMLFPFDTRQMYFNSTAFGCARTIIWLQSSREAAVERTRTPSSRRDDPHEFSIGRLKHERIRISRDDGLLDSAIRVLNFHSERKAILEFEFEGEEGTGLGPTLEFYSLVAAALQGKSLGIFLCDDDTHDHVDEEVDTGHSTRAPGYYIQRAGGLFPAPLPQDGAEIERVCKLFTFLGIFLAKSLQDNRLVDLPLSRSFLKLLCNGGGDNSMVPTLPTTHGHSSHLSIAEGLDDTCSYEEERESVRNMTTNELDRFRKVEDDENDINKLECELSKVSLIEEDLPKEQPKETEAEKPYEPAINYYWFSGLLDESDLISTNPHQGQFVQQLNELAKKKKEIWNDGSLSKEEKKERLHTLLFTTTTGVTCHVEDLGLTFQYFPTSQVYKCSAVDLKPDGEKQALTLGNIEEYIHLMTDFCLYSGIKKQMDAFRDGFNKVFPMEKLQPFSPSELQLMISGEQVPQWNKEDVLSYTEPKYGFTRDSPVYQRFVNVLADMSGEEKKAFLQFTTGCSSLPPGGLANLHPRLTVVRKEGEGDGSYPSVNTCVHYLKLPEYSSEEVLREKLLAATKEKGFHLN